MSAIDKKAYEIAYALCRIGENAGEPLGSMMSNKGVQLLAAVVESDGETAGRLVSVLGYFIKLGAGLDRVSQANVDVMIGQLNLLEDMIHGITVSSVSGPVEGVDLSDVFPDNAIERSSREGPATAKENEVTDVTEEMSLNDSENPITSNQKKEIKDVPVINRSFEDKNDGDSSFTPLISSDIRQSEILDLIRQSGNCRMKDLQEMFPRCSERTLRYDIESLIGRGLIERIGAGSATSYQPADLASFSRSSDE